MHKKYEALADERKKNYLLQDQKQKDENNQKMTKINNEHTEEMEKLRIQGENSRQLNEIKMKEVEGKLEQIKIDGEAKLATINSESQQALKKLDIDSQNSRQAHEDKLQESKNKYAIDLQNSKQDHDKEMKKMDLDGQKDLILLQIKLQEASKYSPTKPKSTSFNY